MTNQNLSSVSHPFDAETWELLPSLLDNLPNPVRLHMWGDPNMSALEREAQRLGTTLAQRFEQIEFAVYPRRINYNFYPVLGVLGTNGDELVDYGVRIVGLPAGFQMTSLIAALQVVSFKGASVEPKTRVQLVGLKEGVTLEILTSAEDESGTLLAKTGFGLAVASRFIRSYLIMADIFPETALRYSARYLPHIVVNGRYHIDDFVEEEALLKHIAKALK